MVSHLTFRSLIQFEFTFLYDVREWYLFVCFLFCFVFGCAAQLAGSQFPDQGLNLGHGSESPEF